MNLPNYLSFIFILLFVNFFISCDEEKKNNIVDTEESINSCEGCHTSYSTLKAIASPDTVEESAGCGGEAPHYEPYDRVYLGGDGYTSFSASAHGELDCIECHNGVDNTSDKALAHSGDFVPHPSNTPQEYCSCHGTEVNQAHNSLHAQGWGQKKRVAVRFGVASFDQLPNTIQQAYDKNCGKCHANCGDCHVNRPQAGGGGLYKGHSFSRTPDMRDNCVACHVSRGGHAFFGVGPGTLPDVHLTNHGFECIDCHSSNEIHGDGVIYEQRYEMALKPSCTNCHPGIEGSNTYHSVHMDDFNCQTCHGQEYNNCGSCHVGGDGARVPAHQNFKIGLNPIPDIKPYKFVTLRLTPHAPDSWEMYGTSLLTNFNAEPTYKYTTPHNIRLWTTRTQVESGKGCFDNCHIINEGDTQRNKELYLFNSDFNSSEDWVRDANQGVVVDGQLPENWSIQ